MYHHTKFYGTGIIPPDEIRGRIYIHWFCMFSNAHLDPTGQFIEGLKHFTVSDVKFHPKKYVEGVWCFQFSNIIQPSACCLMWI